MVVADDSGAFASATGLVFDAQALLGGPRAKRAVIIIVRRLVPSLLPFVNPFCDVQEDGKVIHVAVEEDNLQVTVSSAESALAAL